MDHKLIGRVIREARKRLGKSIDALADEEISAGTISSIERGLGEVKCLKVQYLLQKLGIFDLDDAINEYQIQRRILENHLHAAEDRIRYGSPIKNTLQKIKARLEKNDPFHPWEKFLYGKYNQINHPNTAMDHFNSAIHLARKIEEYDQELNIIAASYLSMAMIEYYANNLHQALEYVEQGIESFVPGGERESIKYALHLNKALFLIKAGRLDEADEVIKKIWPHLNKITRMSIRIKFYLLKAQILKNRKEHDQAFDLVIEAILLARDNDLINLSFTLWATMGQIISETDYKEFAEGSFDLALSFEKKVNTSYLVEVYTDIGKHHITTRDWENAELFINKAADIVEKDNDKLKLIDVFAANGDLQFHQNNLEGAAKYYEKASRLAQEYHLFPKEHQLLYKLIKCYKHDEDKQHQFMKRRFETEEMMEGGIPDEKKNGN